MRSVFVLLSWPHDRATVSVLLQLGRTAGALCVSIDVQLRRDKNDNENDNYDEKGDHVGEIDNNVHIYNGEDTNNSIRHSSDDCGIDYKSI